MASRAEAKAEARRQREEQERLARQRDMRARRLRILAAAGAAAIILVVVAIVISTSGGSSSSTGKGAKVTGASEVNSRFAGIPESGLTLGRPDAPVTLNYFADLKCPICQQFETTGFPTLVDRYVRAGKLRIVYHPQTFVGDQTAPGDSERAARFAIAAGQQGKFWPFSDLFYLNQKDETTAYASDAWLKTLGAKVKGLNVQKALAARNSADVQGTLTQASSEFTRNGFTGTPSYTLGPTGGQQKVFQPNSLAADGFTGAIDQLLSGQ